MALTDEALSPAPDDVEEVAWNLESLVDGNGAAGVDELLDRAETMLPPLLEQRDHVATMDAATLAAFMSSLSDLQELIGKAASYAGLKFAVDTSDPANGALMQRVQERATAIGTQLIWFELEWAAIPDEAADTILADDRIAPYRYHLESARRYRPHLLTEPEEKIDAEKSVTGRSAWVRLFSELSAEITVTLPDGVEAPLERGLALLMHPDRDTRRARGRGHHGGTRTRAAHPRVHLQHAAGGQEHRRPAPQLPDLDHQPQPRQPSNRRERRSARRRSEASVRHPAALVHDEAQDPRPSPTRRLRPIRVGRRERDPRRVG